MGDQPLGAEPERSSPTDHEDGGGILARPPRGVLKKVLEGLGIVAVLAGLVVGAELWLERSELLTPVLQALVIAILLFMAGIVGLLAEALWQRTPWGRKRRKPTEPQEPSIGEPTASEHPPRYVVYADGVEVSEFHTSEEAEADARGFREDFPGMPVGVRPIHH